ncbi:hypothetical protein [Pelagibacterium sp.]|uniref:hypothetical protein n=1 Tax=Pelagibacterium sp. TaxID=1967288 RepID=UPI003A8DCEEB
MNKTVLSLAALIGLSATGGAFAQTLDFGSLDANGDGVISMEELQAAIPDLTPESFAMLDTDTDGALSAEEFAALMPATEAPANTMEAPATDSPMAAPAAQ